MPKHKNQRVGVFVDIQNMYYSAKQFYHTKVNFAHILKRAVAGRQLVRAIAYVIKADIKEEESFFDALEKIGYDLRSKDLQTFYGGAKKGDWDVGIAMDIMRMAAKLDVVVLVSGDGDFKDLVEHVKSLGCRAEVIAFRKTASSRILSEADEFTDLDKELDKVLIKDERDHQRNGEHPKNGDQHPKPEIKEIKSEAPKQDAKESGKEAQPEQAPVNVVLSQEIPKQESKQNFQRKDFQRNDRPRNQGFQNKPYQNKPYQKPYQNKPYQNKPFQSKPFQRNDRPGFRRDDSEFRRDEPSLIQMLNMDQPDLNKANKPAPQPAKDVLKQHMPKPVVKQEPPKLGPEPKKAPEDKKGKPKAKKASKPKKKKEESMLKKVISSVTKKK